MSNRVRRFAIAAVTLLTLPLAGCMGIDKLESAEDINAAVDFSSLQNCGVMGFRKMYGLIFQPRCAGCHRTQEPTIASGQFSKAHEAARANASKLLLQAGNGHGGCAKCDLTPEDELYQDLAQWVMQENCDAPSGSPGTGGNGGTQRVSVKPVGLPSPLLPGDYRVDISRMSSGYVGAELRFTVGRLGNGWTVTQVSTTAPPVNLILTAPRLRIGGDSRDIVSGELTVSDSGSADPPLNGVTLVWLSGNDPLVFEVDNIRSRADSPGDGPRAVYAEAADRKRTPEESLAYFTDTVRPAIQGANCASCHGAGDPVLVHSEALMMLSSGSGPTNNRYFNKPRQANGVQHSGGVRCASNTSAPCLQISDWWRYEFE